MKNLLIMKTKLITMMTVLGCGLGVVNANSSVIYAEARKEWPQDKEMQKYYVKTETKAWHAFVKQSGSAQVPSLIIKQIKGWCKQKWPRKYGMQWHMLKNEMSAYETLNKMKSAEQKKAWERAKKKWPKSYEMQLYSVEHP